jgi:hypothetical protein
MSGLRYATGGVALALIGVVAGSVLLPAAARADDRYELTIKNHRFIPDTIVIPANTKVILVVKNADSTAEEFDSSALDREKLIAGGSQGIVYIGPLGPGTYNFEGEFHDDTAKGRVIVK